MTSSHSSISNQTNHILTIKPVPEIIKAVYYQDFSVAQRLEFQRECQRLFDQEIAVEMPGKSKSAKSPRLGEVKAEINDIVILRVSRTLHPRWIQLAKVQPLELSTDEDFLILHSLLNTQPTLNKLNEAFNNFVLHRAYGPLARNARHLFHNPIIVTDRDRGELLIVVGTIGVLVALIFSTLVGMYYAAQKAYKSLTNIFHAEKVVKSIFRLAATLGCAAAGIFTGMKLGAMVGSVYPGIGTLVGAVIGGIAGSGIGAGLGAFFAKYIGKLVAWACVSLGVYGKEQVISSTNPEKYRLSNSQIVHCRSKGITDTTRIYEMMEDAKIQKSTINTFFDSAGDQEKSEYNSLIRAIKVNPEVVRYGVCLNKKTNNLFIWSKKGSWERYGLVKPDEFLAPRPMVG